MHLINNPKNHIHLYRRYTTHYSPPRHSRSNDAQLFGSADLSPAISLHIICVSNISLSSGELNAVSSISPDAICHVEGRQSISSGSGHVPVLQIPVILTPIRAVSRYVDTHRVSACIHTYPRVSTDGYVIDTRDDTRKWKNHPRIRGLYTTPPHTHTTHLSLPLSLFGVESLKCERRICETKEEGK